MCKRNECSNNDSDNEAIKSSDNDTGEDFSRENSGMESDNSEY